MKEMIWNKDIVKNSFVILQNICTPLEAKLNNWMDRNIL